MKKSAYTGPSLSRYQFEGLKNRGWILEYASKVYKRHPNIVALIELDIGGYQQVVVKSFGKRELKSPLLSPLTESPAQKAWNATRLLIDTGVPVPHPIAVSTTRQGGFIMNNYLISEYIGRHRNAARCLSDSIYPQHQKTLIINGITGIISTMHNAGLIHNNLTADNFLVSETDPENIYLVGVSRLRQNPKITIADKMTDIARLNLCDCALTHDHDDCRWLYFLIAYDADNAERNLDFLKKAIAAPAGK